MSWYRATIAPRLIDRLMGAPLFAKGRQIICAELAGTVVEIGFGSGRNVPFYPAALSRVYAVEPSSLAREIARARIAASSVEVEFVGLIGESVPLPDACADHALLTFTLCSVQDPARVLSEIRRLLRPGGRLYLLEHGLAPTSTVQKWQHRLNHFEEVVADGCQLIRDPLQLLEAAGYSLERVTQRFPGKPTPWTYITMATATP